MSDAAAAETLNLLSSSQLSIDAGEPVATLEYADDGSVYLVTKTKLTFSIVLDNARAVASFEQQPATRPRHFLRSDGRSVDVKAPGAQFHVGVGMGRAR